MPGITSTSSSLLPLHVLLSRVAPLVFNVTQASIACRFELYKMCQRNTKKYCTLSLAPRPLSLTPDKCVCPSKYVCMVPATEESSPAQLLPSVIKYAKQIKCQKQNEEEKERQSKRNRNVCVCVCVGINVFLFFNWCRLLPTNFQLTLPSRPGNIVLQLFFMSRGRCESSNNNQKCVSNGAGYWQ